MRVKIIWSLINALVGSDRTTIAMIYLATNESFQEKEKFRQDSANPIFEVFKYKMLRKLK